MYEALIKTHNCHLFMWEKKKQIDTYTTVKPGCMYML